MKHHRPYQLPPPTPLTPRPLPTGLDAAAVLTRERAMIDAGTHPMIAERLARSAAENQTLRDRHRRLTVRSDDPF